MRSTSLQVLRTLAAVTLLTRPGCEAAALANLRLDSVDQEQALHLHLGVARQASRCHVSQGLCEDAVDNSLPCLGTREELGNGCVVGAHTKLDYFLFIPEAFEEGLPAPSQ
jgi:hypothetical protein